MATCAVLDFAAHVVFNYIKNAQPPFQPDKDGFGAIVKDLLSLKDFLQSSGGVSTDGAKLGIHPGLRGHVPGFADRVKELLKERLSRPHLQVISFMGIPGSFEPWIFFKVHIGPNDELIRQKISGHFAPSGPTSQMLAFIQPNSVDPAPALDAQAVAEGFGISTAVLFANDIGSHLNDSLLPGATAQPQQQWKRRDVADLIANPLFRNTSNTDCVSCHTESTRRKLVPGLTSQAGVAFQVPAGISNLDVRVLPTDKWNVRDFGWGIDQDGTSHPTITQRAANEAIESVDVINRDYADVLTPSSP